MIRNIIFDIGLVLIRFDWDSYMEKLFPADAGVRKAVTEAMWHNPDWNQLDRGVLPLPEVEQLFIENAPAYADAIREALRRLGEAPEKQPYAIPWIEQLKAMGYHVYYLSNYFEYLMQEAPQVLDFIPHTDGGIFSCHEKITKPDPEIYQRLMARYQLVPEECVFIDDTAVNIAAANALGIHGFQFAGYEKSYLEIMAFLEQNRQERAADI